MLYLFFAKITFPQEVETKPYFAKKNYMKKLRLYAIAVICFSSFIIGCNSADKKTASDNVSLKFNLQKGKTYLYSMQMNMENNMQGQKMDTDMDFDYSLQILDDKDSLKTIRTTYDRIAMKMDAGVMKVDFDTNQPQKDSVVNIQANPMTLMSNMFYAMKGKSFDMKVNSKGEVVQVTGLEEMKQTLINSMTDENLKGAMSQAFASQFNEDNIKNSFSQALNIFPDKPIKVGDTWNKKMSMGGMAAADMTTTYTVKDIKADNVVLDVKADINMAQAKGAQTGTMHVSSETGLVTEANLEQKFTAPTAMTIHTKITGKEK